MISFEAGLSDVIEEADIKDPFIKLFWGYRKKLPVETPEVWDDIQWRSGGE